MSTATLNNLLEYLYGTLTVDNMRWVGEHLIEHARKEEESSPKPYTMAEINAMLDEAEADFAAGPGSTDAVAPPRKPTAANTSVLSERLERLGELGTPRTT